MDRKMPTANDMANARPEIVESYRDFKPPANFKKSLGILLDAVPAKYLVGLKTILLTNRAALTRSQRRRRTWSRNHKIRLAGARGWYQPAWNSGPAVICLYVDNILQSEPAWVRQVPLMRYEALGTVLYHEIGHHIHAVHKPIHEDKEVVADDWSRRLFLRFLRLRYWYLVPLMYAVGHAIRIARRFARPATARKSARPGNQLVRHGL